MLSIADVYQDAVLLVDLDGTLVINANDCNDHGWSPFVRREAATREGCVPARTVRATATPTWSTTSTPTAIASHRGAAKKIPPGRGINAKMQLLGAKRFVPFASMHQYQREDSVWANEYTTPLEDLTIGFDPAFGELLPPFIRYDCIAGSVTRLDPPTQSDRPATARELR